MKLQRYTYICMYVQLLGMPSGEYVLRGRPGVLHEQMPLCKACIVRINR
uniref:Uncharacterized protein n=1 Tax=Setaria italica TaxID=4555 RepID=K3YFI6_SETIT